MTTRVLGVDPGGQNTGVTLVDVTLELCSGRVLERGDQQPIHDYATAVAREVTELATGQHAIAEGMGTKPVTLIGVEGLNRVTPQMGKRPIDLYPTVEAGIVLGACFGMLRARGLHVAWVPPGGHGDNPLRTYPSQLIGAREKKGTGRLRHARSAYDVAFAARSMVRMGMA